MAEKPTAAFVLSLIGGILMLITGLIIVAAGAIGGALLGVMGFGWLGGIVLAIGALHLVFGILITIWINTDKHWGSRKD